MGNEFQSSGKNEDRLLHCLQLDPYEENSFLEWNSLLSTYPNQSKLRIKAAEFYQKSFQLEKAIQLITAAPQVYQVSLKLRLKHLQLLMGLQLWDKALELLSSELLNTPNNKALKQQKIICLIKKKDIEAGVRYFSKVENDLTPNQIIRIHQLLKNDFSTNAILQETSSDSLNDNQLKSKLIFALTLDYKQEEIENCINEFPANYRFSQKDKSKILMLGKEHNQTIQNKLINLTKKESDQKPLLINQHKLIPVTSSEVDIVYTWVDLSDPTLKQSFNSTTKSSIESLDAQQNHLRYIQHDEIQFSLLCLQENVPWIRNVFIVTNGQQFETTFLKEPFRKKIKFIHQETLISDTYNVGDTFNSTIIESFLWRIPELSECFLYACDDYFIGRPIQLSDIMNSDSVPYCSIHHTNLERVKFVEFLSPQLRTEKTYPESYILNAQKLFESKFGFKPDYMHNHQVMILTKRACQYGLELFSDSWEKLFPDQAVRNNETVHTLLLFSWLAIQKGYQLINEGKTGDFEVFHHGFNEENRRFLQIRKPTYFCINNLSNQDSKTQFDLLNMSYI